MSVAKLGITLGAEITSNATARPLKGSMAAGR